MEDETKGDLFCERICRYWSNVLYRIEYYIVIRNRTVQNLSFKSTLRLKSAQVSPHGLPGMDLAHQETHRQLGNHHLIMLTMHPCLGRRISLLHQRCPTELPALTEMFPTCFVWISSHQPHVAFEHLKYGSAIPELGLHLIEIALRCP